MFNVALFGTDPTSITCREIIEKFYNKVIPNTKGNRFRVVAYIANGRQDSVLDDVAVVNIPQVCAFYEAGLIHAVIIPRELFAGQNNLVKLMVQNGINIHDIYISGRIQNKTLVDQDMPTFLTSYLETKYLPYNLYDDALTTSDLKSRLLQPFERCRYCKKPVLVDWEQISHPSSLSDWVID